LAGETWTIQVNNGMNVTVALPVMNRSP
jgi:hypothetical protein